MALLSLCALQQDLYLFHLPGCERPKLEGLDVLLNLL